MALLFYMGNCSILLLYPLFFSFSCFFSSLSYRLFNVETRFNFHCILLIIESLGMMLIGILELISIRINKTTSKKVEETNLSLLCSLNLSKSSLKSKITKKTKVIRHMLLVSFLHTFAQFSMLYLRMKNLSGVNEIFKILKVITTGVIVFFAFSSKLYSHHYLSLLLIILPTIGSTILSFPVITPNYDVAFFIGYFFEVLSYGSLEVYEKWIMEIKYVSPYLLIFYQGLFSLSYKIIIIFILNFIPCPNATFCQGNTMINVVDFFDQVYPIGVGPFIGYCFLNITCLALYHVLRLLTNKTYSPTHRIVADILVIVYFFWVDDRGNDYSGNKAFYIIMKMILYFVLFLGCLIYHELIILNFCKLNYNTQIEIDKRGVRDSSVETDGLIPDEEKMQTSEENDLN